MTVTTQIPSTSISGQQTFNFAATTAPFLEADVTIDRTGAAGLNSLTPADTLQVDIQYQLPGDPTWHDCQTDVLHGGTVTKGGVTVTTSGFGVSIGHPFPTGTVFRVIATASKPVTIQGSVVFS